MRSPGAEAIAVREPALRKLLFITSELPFPALSGGKLKSLRLLEHLSSRFDVTIACPLKLEDGKHLADFERHFEGRLAAVMTEAVEVSRSPLNMVRSYVLGIPLNVLRTRAKALGDRIANAAQGTDIIYLDHYEVFQYAPREFSGPIVYHAHNAYHKLWARYGDASSNLPLRLAARYEAARVRTYEAKVCNASDIVYAAPRDIDALRPYCNAHVHWAETAHLGDDAQLTLDPLTWSKTEERLVYVGYLGWEANVLGLLWFLKHVWPKVRATHPSFQLDIVGKNPDERLKTAVARADNVRLLGFVADLEDVYRRSRLCIAPLTFGSGMKVKVLDAMARGIPVVTTPTGAESIDARHREHLLVCESAEAMARDIGEVLTDEALWSRLARNSRELIQTRYTWASVFSDMDRALADVISTERPTATLAVS